MAGRRRRMFGSRGKPSDWGAGPQGVYVVAADPATVDAAWERIKALEGIEIGGLSTTPTTALTSSTSATPTAIFGPSEPTGEPEPHAAPPVGSAPSSKRDILCCLKRLARWRLDPTR